MEAATNLQCVRMMQSHIEETLPDSVTAPAGIFRCKDGGHLFIVVLRQPDFERVCKVLGLDDMGADPRLGSPQQRYEHMAEVNARVAKAFLERDTQAWVADLTEVGVQNEAVLDYQAFLDHPHIRETGAVAWLHQPGFTDTVPMPNIPGASPFEDGAAHAQSPTLGEHTREVLDALKPI